MVLKALKVTLMEIFVAAILDIAKGLKCWSGFRRPHQEELEIWTLLENVEVPIKVIMISVN